MKTILKEISRPDLKEPVLIGGIPDSGFVAKIIMEHLIEQLKAELFAEIYSFGFPPQVVIRKDKTAELLKNQLYFHRSKDGGSDLILFTGDTQPISPEAAFGICNAVLDLALSLGAKTVVTVGAHIVGRFVDIPRVYVTATSADLVKELSEKHALQTQDHGNITWMNGLLFGLAKTRGLEGIFVSGETSGYVIDAKAAEAVLNRLGEILSIEMDMTSLQQKAKETERIIGLIQQRQQRDERVGWEQPPSDVYR